MNCDYLIVGAGIFGSVIAERIANDLGKKVIIIDKRDHIGGNCYSKDDEGTGIEYHYYGTHIFHTSDKEVWNYITKFTEFNGYYHQVLTTYKNKVYQMPINLETINSYYNLNLKPYEVGEFLLNEIAKEEIKEPKNLEEKAISLIGRPLYEAFIRGYTMKQWEKDPKDLPADIITRLPVRYNYKEDYFNNSRWQGIPLNGYTAIFERMLDHPNIQVELNCDYFECKEKFQISEKIVYTGPIDRFFDYKFGILEWRSVDFRKEYKDVEDFQGTSVMNYADVEAKYTRIHEPRHLHPERVYNKEKTVIFYETSKSDADDPYYTVNNKKNNDLAKQYKDYAKDSKDAIIGGRLGEYAYYDMDKAILSALKCYQDNILKR
jgi:UDP-galactopyranose mutase